MDQDQANKGGFPFRCQRAGREPEEASAPGPVRLSHPPDQSHGRGSLSLATYLRRALPTARRWRCPWPTTQDSCCMTACRCLLAWAAWAAGNSDRMPAGVV